MQKITRTLFRVWELFYILIMVTGLHTIMKIDQIIYLKVGDFCYMLIIVQEMKRKGRMSFRIRSPMAKYVPPKWGVGGETLIFYQNFKGHRFLGSPFLPSQSPWWEELLGILDLN